MAEDQAKNRKSKAGEDETVVVPVPEAQPGDVDMRILELARKDPDATVSSLSRKTGASRDRVRARLRKSGITLPSQRASNATPAPVNAAAEISAAVDVAQADIEAAYAKEQATVRLRDIHESGVIVVDELAPEARGRGMLTSELLRRALDALRWRENLEREHAVLLAPDKGIDVEYLVDYALTFVEQHHGAPARVRLLEAAIDRAAGMVAEAKRANAPITFAIDVAKEMATVRALNSLAGR